MVSYVNESPDSIPPGRFFGKGKDQSNDHSYHHGMDISEGRDIFRAIDRPAMPLESSGGSGASEIVSTRECEDLRIGCKTIDNIVISVQYHSNFPLPAPPSKLKSKRASESRCNAPNTMINWKTVIYHSLTIYGDPKNNLTSLPFPFPDVGSMQSMLHPIQESCLVDQKYNEAKNNILTISPNVVIQAWKKYLAPWLTIVFRSFSYAAHNFIWPEQTLDH
ncbi:uncharacterized protein EAF01_011449 [Botrytis porri]|uniref:uncharacterized protein n=1 Tax=Botrytis porri TaxID=87229 RepID=UPI0018FFDFD4|nr:uncharacterized protein EAF01_011449 [Botrytis porri]KAF7885384.1 hypothetical protein EAF01_011449 [Botrytis porri]